MSLTSAGYDAWRLLSGSKFDLWLTFAIFPHEVNRSDGKPGAKNSRFLDGAEYCRRTKFAAAGFVPMGVCRSKVAAELS